VSLSGDADHPSTTGHAIAGSCNASGKICAVHIREKRDAARRQRSLRRSPFSDPEWPELIHPFASAIDVSLTRAPTRTHMMLASKPGWVAVPGEPGDQRFDEYPDEPLMAWHQRHGLLGVTRD
jgi:hypothetical protein